MSKSQYLSVASAGAIVIALFAAGSAAAQSGPAAKAKAETEVGEVVVTGSFIAGTPEDSVMPVEAVTLEELRQQGSPSNLDLVKGLSEIGSVAGEANRANAFAIGSQSINLRGVSASRTVVVFNGRRLLEQYSASVGRFNNIALIPNAAIGRVEVLKDGGATTYGADAVGGVVNYITRKNLDGVETNANYRYIKDSDGDWDADISAGKVGENWNVLGVFGYIHRSELDLADRDWALRDYLHNPAGWNGSGSPGAYVFQRATGVAAAPFGTLTPSATAASGNRYTGDRQMGSTGVVRDPFCAQVGGFAGFSATPSPLCYFQTGLLSNLVEKQNTYQGYAEGNYRWDNGIKAHGEVLFYKLDIPRIPIDAFGGVPQNFPLTPGSATGASQLIGSSSGYAVAGSNPAVRALLGALSNSNGSPIFGDPNTPGTQAFQILNGGRVGLNTGTWRPFAYGGHPIPDLDTQHNHSTTWRGTFELSGDVPTFAGFDLKWTAAVTYNNQHYVLESNDMLVDRLQAALNGLGGPNCTTSTPGANGCQYFNPFSSAIRSNIYTGQANPGAVTTGNFAGYAAGQGLQNDPQLVNWLYEPINLVRDTQFTIVDLLLSGQTPFRLWAEDPISIAVGGQYRVLKEVANMDPLSDRRTSPCATVGVTTCASRTGPLAYNRAANLYGITQDSDRKYPVRAAFFEIQAPILDTLVANVSGRYERFYSDVSDVNNDVFVPAGSLKWQALDWLAFRGTAGRTFSQVNPPENVAPTVTGNVAAATQFGGTAVTYTSFNYPNLDVKPERGFNYNLGSIVQFGGFRANLDYYNIKVTDVIRAQTSAQVVNALVQAGQTGAGALINCQSPLLTQKIDLLAGRPFVELNGACVPGTSALNSAAGAGGLNGGRINFLGGQGTQPALVNGGTLKTSGLDIGASYRFDDLWGAQLTLTADWTHILTYEASDYVVAGITVATGYKGIGQFNELTGRNGQHVAKDRGSFGFNVRKGRHSFNWSTRFVSSFRDDDITNFQEQATYNANIGANGVVPTGAACVDTNPTSPPVPAGAGTGVFGASTGATVGYCAGQNVTVLSGQKVPVTFTTDLSYQVQLPWDTTMTVTVQNLFNEDPEFSRDAINYDAYTGSPLGRTLRVGVRKRW